MPPTFLADTPSNSDLEGKLNCKLNSYDLFYDAITQESSDRPAASPTPRMQMV